MADNFINTVIYCKMQMQFRKVVVIKITKRSLHFFFFLNQLFKTINIQFLKWPKGINVFLLMSCCVFCLRSHVLQN